MSLVKRNFALALGAALAVAASMTIAETQIRMHTAGHGNSAFVFSATMQSVLQRNLDVGINMTSGMASSRSTLDAANGRVDFFISAPAINHYMDTGSAMYAEMNEAPELYKNVRSVLNFPLGPYHVITYADSGIQTLKDIKGKRVFLGPPGGGATTVALAIVEGSTGYKAGVDYDQARLDWSSGQQAFQDRQVDLAIIPTELPSAIISQYALLGEIRLIGIQEEHKQSEAMQSVLAIPGRTIERIQPDIYGENQTNTEIVEAVGSWVGIGTHKGVDDELVYNITKTIFENIEAFHKAAEWMKMITLETALSEINAPLHAGAYRYYKEAGVEVPSDLIPPEIK
ncbi:TAXI family TRAP transporter solute-binding subunit [Marinobacter salexigens]|uniref:TAXI family TRAP transporter solute-binding subunit n=1 Tax=Marinobacter salexigens TaxID=1925763 RepID=A0ABS6A939_9GAMM|nr:TAXI family TRAP transporter solute-binding subunit [Marinobacter salexigens]MBU2874661.1 TAXI family TRAP transporter solute-binding subunit [Marinobacter salexigens]